MLMLPAMSLIDAAPLHMVLRFDAAMPRRFDAAYADTLARVFQFALIFFVLIRLLAPPLRCCRRLFFTLTPPCR